MVEQEKKDPQVSEGAGNAAEGAGTEGGDKAAGKMLLDKETGEMVSKK